MPATSVRNVVTGLALAAVLVLGAVAPVAASKQRTTSAPGTSGALVLTRTSGPARTIVTEADGDWVATFTDGSRTVALAGAPRAFVEAGVAPEVRTATWVRLLAQPFAGTVDLPWLAAARTSTEPDVLASAFEYVVGAPIVERDGRRWSGDASYGPLQPDGTRAEGSDWNDYQQVSATYGTTVDRPEVDQAGALDCSGYMRMLWGVRHGLPMSLAPTGAALPRRSFEMLDSAPGTVIVPNRGKQVTRFDRLQTGDLVFFDASTDDGTQIDHVGMYLGLDTAGNRRFISSRKSADGPTMGDVRGRSTLDGTGFYASAFRAVRRL